MQIPWSAERQWPRNTLRSADGQRLPQNPRPHGDIFHAKMMLVRTINAPTLAVLSNEYAESNSTATAKDTAPRSLNYPNLPFFSLDMIKVLQPVAPSTLCFGKWPRSLSSSIPFGLGNSCLVLATYKPRATKAVGHLAKCETDRSHMYHRKTF